MKKVFSDNLPRKGKYIDWENSVGYNVKFIYDNIEGEIEILNYYKSYLDIYYNNNIFHILASSFLDCRLGNFLGKHTKNYKYNIKDIIETNISKIKIIEKIRILYGKYSYKGYKYRCLNCGNIDEISEANLSYGRGCNVCCVPSRKVLKGFNDLWTIHPEIAKLLKNPERGYEISFGSGKSEIFICPECSYEKEYKIDSIVNKKFSCHKCGDGLSYPNKFAFNLLEQLKLDFESEYSPDWIKPKRYDFYFEFDNKGYIFEMDGGLGHGNENNLNGKTKKERKETKKKDNHKDKLAKEHDIEVIRIKCLKSDLEYIKENILHSRLSELFDLSNIDWLKCHEYACKSLVKVVCDFWNNEIKNTFKIGKIMKKSKTTIIKYLKQGAKLGWCDYNSKQETINNGKNNGGKNKKKVICINTKQIFNSTKDANDFIGLKWNGVTACCNSKNKHRSAGKHPETGEKLYWMYYEEYIKLKNKIA